MGCTKRDLLWCSQEANKGNLQHSQNIRSKVKTSSENEDWFEIQPEVRQGSVLSPLFFILFMDKCIREQNPDENLNTDLIYADDHTVITKLIEDLQQRITD